MSGRKSKTHGQWKKLEYYNSQNHGSSSILSVLHASIFYRLVSEQGRGDAGAYPS